MLVSFIPLIRPLCLLDDTAASCYPSPPHLLHRLRLLLLRSPNLKSPAANVITASQHAGDRGVDAQGGTTQRSYDKLPSALPTCICQRGSADGFEFCGTDGFEFCETTGIHVSRTTRIMDSMDDGG